MNDLISRQAAIDALWKALYEYEDKTEKQFQESEDLDVGDWILHRIFVQNMSYIDRQTILNLPSAQQWTPCCKGMPDEQYSDTIGDFKYILCTTIWGDVRPYKYGTPIGGDAPHFWHGPQAMDEKVVAWAYMPAPYTEGENG